MALVAGGGAAEVNRNLDAWRLKKVEDLSFLAQQVIAPELTKYARANRPWTDRTGNARRGLRGYSRTTATHLVIGIAHTVFYGKFLEKRHAGRYAILGPTLRAKREFIRRMIELSFLS